MPHIENRELAADTPGAQEILDVIVPVKHVKADIFKEHPRKNIPERKKPTAAKKRAQRENIRKAQETRKKNA